MVPDHKTGEFAEIESSHQNLLRQYQFHSGRRMRSSIHHSRANDLTGRVVEEVNGAHMGVSALILGATMTGRRNQLTRKGIAHPL